MVMMGHPFESCYWKRRNAALVSDAPAGPIVTVDAKKFSRGGRIAAFPGFYLRKSDTISPVKGA
jgi:hypothetical protein